MNLKQMIIEVRLVLKDVGVKGIADPLLISSANEAKDQIVGIMRQANEDYFLASTVSQMTTAAAPNGSLLILPADFQALRDIYCNDSGYEGISFIPMKRSDPRFRVALLSGGSYQSGGSHSYYDFFGNSRMIFAPGFDVALNLTIDYIKSVQDMANLDSEPEGIPAEFHHYIVASMICDALRMTASPALVAWQESVNEKRRMIEENIQPRQLKDPVFVRGFMESEIW